MSQLTKGSNRRTIEVVGPNNVAEAYRLAQRLKPANDVNDVEEEVVIAPVLSSMQRRISAIRADQLKALQLRLFPELPDDRGSLGCFRCRSPGSSTTCY